MAGPNFLELLYGPHLKGVLSTDASSRSTQYAGRTTLSSGSATVTVSTAMVGSDSLILFGTEFANVASGGAAEKIHVSTINPGNFFTLSTDDGVATAGQDIKIMWLLLPTSDV